VVLILLGVLLAAGVFAFVGLRSDTGAARNERLARQLFDCAEQGLQVAKQFFSLPSSRQQWSAFYQSNVCSPTMPCPPFAIGQSGTPPVGYPTAAPYRNKVLAPLGGAAAATANVTLNYQIGIFNNPGDPSGITSEGDDLAVVYSRCADDEPAVAGGSLPTGQSRTLQAVIKVSASRSGDYFGQAGFGYSNQGNTNNTQ
jgi:hypothetical protein